MSLLTAAENQNTVLSNRLVMPPMATAKSGEMARSQQGMRLL